MDAQGEISTLKLMSYGTDRLHTCWLQELVNREARNVGEISYDLHPVCASGCAGTYWSEHEEHGKECMTALSETAEGLCRFDHI